MFTKIHRLFNPLPKSAAEIVTTTRESTERDLLETESALDYHTAMRDMFRQRLTRLQQQENIQRFPNYEPTMILTTSRDIQ